MSNKWNTNVGGSGDVVGPGSSTDNGLATFDGTTGKLIKNNTATLSSGVITSTTLRTASGEVKFVYEIVDFGDILGSTNINGQDFYHLFMPKQTFVCASGFIYCASVGADPTNLDFGLYNSSSTKIAGITSTVLATAGLITFTLTTPVQLDSNSFYYVGLAGDASDSSFVIKNNSLNDTLLNRFASNSTVQATVPAGSSTANRFWIRLME